MSEADLKKAERDGHAPDLPPISLDHHQRARDKVRHPIPEGPSIGDVMAIVQPERPSVARASVCRRTGELDAASSVSTPYSVSSCSLTPLVAVYRARALHSTRCSLGRAQLSHRWWREAERMDESWRVLLHECIQ